MTLFIHKLTLKKMKFKFNSNSYLWFQINLFIINIKISESNIKNVKINYKDWILLNIMLNSILK